jgi:hypothetical protein
VAAVGRLETGFKPVLNERRKRQAVIQTLEADPIVNTRCGISMADVENNSLMRSSTVGAVQEGTGNVSH